MEVSIRGKKNVLLLLDGVPTTIEELSALSSANIKSIDIITNPDACYDAEGTGGIINIVSQKEKGKGLSGQVAANYGFNHFVNGNIALHYASKGFSLNFSYQTKYEDDIIHSELYRKFVQSGNSLEQNVRSARTVFNNNIALGATSQINSKNKLQADLRLNIPRLSAKTSPTESSSPPPTYSSPPRKGKSCSEKSVYASNTRKSNFTARKTTSIKPSTTFLSPPA